MDTSKIYRGIILGNVMGKKDYLKIIPFNSKFKKRNKLPFLYEMATLLSCGISIKDISLFLSEKFKFEKALIEDNLKKGEMFSIILSKINYFSKEELEMFKISEETGEIKETFLKVYQDEKDKEQLKGKLISLLIYPMIMMILLIMFFILSLIFMIPMMADLLRTLDIHEGFIFKIEEFKIYLFENINTILPICVMLFLFTIYHLKNSKAYLKLLLGKEYSTLIEIKFLDSLLRLILSGKNIIEALGLKKDNTSFKVSNIIDALNNGETLSTSLERGGFCKNLVNIVRINEEGGTMTKGMEIYIKNGKSKINDTIEKRVKLIEPLSIILIGIFILVILTSIMGPLMSGFSKIK